MNKSPVKSKTIWFNTLSLVAAVATTLAGQDLVKEYPIAVTIVGGVVAATNIALRFVTDQGISFEA